MRAVSFLLCFLFKVVVTEATRGTYLTRRSESNVRPLQQRQPPLQTLNFRANYTADFQHLSDPGCNDVSPELYLNCHGRSMTILSASDETITCMQMEEPVVPDGTSYSCTNSCSGTECQDVYLLKNAVVPSVDGPFGSISFLCEGDTVQQVDASFSFLGGTNGTCTFSTAIITNARNFNVGRFGVSCPTPDGLSRGYVYDDTYFECRTVDSLTDDLTHGPDDIYTCFSGSNCTESGCNFPFPGLTLEANVASFSKCVDSLVSMAPTVSPTPPNISAFEFSAQFEASWSIQLDLQTGNCVDSNPSVTVACENGSFIEYVNSTDLSINCIKTSQSELDCMASDISSLHDQFVSVFYDCVGPSRPSARVTYPESFPHCENITVTGTLQHAVSLGVACLGETSLFFFNDDLLFECADANHDFETTPSVVCSEGATFVAGSTSDMVQTIPSVAVVMDEYWFRQDLFESCFTQLSVPLSPSTPTPTVTPPSTSSPMSSPPVTLSPTFLRSNVPTRFPVALETNISRLPTNAPTTSAPFSEIPSQNRSIFTTTTPVANVPTTPINITDNGQGGSSTGAAIGGIAAGLVVLSVIGFFVRRKYKKQRTSSKQPELNATDADDDDPFVTSGISGSVAPVTAAPVEDSTSNVTYKCQCRSLGEQEGRLHVPFAHAVAVSEESSLVKVPLAGTTSNAVPEAGVAPS